VSDATVGTYLLLVDIFRGAEHFAMVASGRPFSFQGTTYEPADMKFREANMRSSGKASSQGFNFSIPASSDAGKFLKLPVDSDATKVIMRMVSTGGEQVFLLRGVVQNVSDEVRMIGLEIGTLRVSLGHVGLNLKYANTCSHSLYNSRCKVPKQGFPQQILGGFKATTGGGYVIHLSVAVTDQEHYDEGFLTIDHQGVKLYSPITKIVSYGTGSLVFLPRWLGVDLQNGVAILYKGCDLTFTTCKTRFNNTENFGGFPFFTGSENPFNNHVLD